MNLIQSENHLPFFKVLTLAMLLLLSTTSLHAQMADSTVEPGQLTDTVAAEPVPNYFDNVGGRQGDTIQLRHVPSSVVDSLKKLDAFWYANAKLKQNKQQQQVPQGAPKWVRMSVWALIIALFVAALIWYLASSNILIFEKRRKQIYAANDAQERPEDIFSINYQREIEKAIAIENYRLAIRLMFLQLLRNLSNKHIIQYRQERTNFEYLSQLLSTVYYKDFFRLTRNYEYAWYGKFDVTREAFGTIKADFENFERQLK